MYVFSPGPNMTSKQVLSSEDKTMRELKGQPTRGLRESGSSKKPQKYSEVKEMTTQPQNIQNGLSIMDQISGINSKNERGIEMLKAEKQSWFPRNLSNIVPVNTRYAPEGQGLAPLAAACRAQ